MKTKENLLNPKSALSIVREAKKWKKEGKK